MQGLLLTHEALLAAYHNVDSCSGDCDDCGTWNNKTCAYDCARGFYGRNCSSKCSTLCKNGATVNESSCSCVCNEKQYGDKCECKYAFTGDNCDTCKVGTCKHSGIFDLSTCRCNCMPGYGGLQCESECADKDGVTDCQARFEAGECIKHDQYMETKCMASCGFCNVTVQESETTVAPTTSKCLSNQTVHGNTHNPCYDGGCSWNSNGGILVAVAVLFALYLLQQFEYE